MRISVICLYLILISCHEDTVVSSRPTGDMKDDPIDKNLIPEAPILSPKEALKAFDLEPGFTIELVVSEPTIQTPVVAHFDYDGHLWVLTMPSYMIDTIATNEKNTTGQLLKLSDTDQDGLFETKEIKLDSLILPRAFKILDHGILLAEPPNLWWYPFKGDQLTQRILVDSVYAPDGDVEHKPNGLYWNLDNWIYNAKSAKRYRQDTSGNWYASMTEFRGQWGITSDDYGRLFYNHNSAALLSDDLMPNWLPENPYYTSIGPNMIGASKTNNKVHPSRINPGVNRAYLKDVLDSVGKLDEMTAACGALLYRNQRLPSYYNNYFVCEPSANLVQRIYISSNTEGHIIATPSDSTREFLRSTDERFRPVHLFDGPDGCIYVVDMHRGVIQHKNYLTTYLKRQIGYRDLQSHLDLGRIYRICHQSDRAPIARLSGLSNAALAERLVDRMAFYRDRSRELLIQRRGHAAVESTHQALMLNDSKPSTSLIWTMEGLGMINESLIRKWIKMANPDLSLTLLKLIQNRPINTDIIPWLDTICKIKSDYLAAFAIIKNMLPVHEYVAMSWIKKVETKYPGDPIIQDAIMRTITGFEKKYLAFTIQYPRLIQSVIDKKASLQTLESRMKPDVLRSLKRGYDLFINHCGICHGKNGAGINGLAPSLVKSDWLEGNADRLIKIALDGLKGPILINGKEYGKATTMMPGHRQQSAMALNDQNLADILTYIRGMYGDQTDRVLPQRVRAIRDSTAARGRPYEMIDF